MSSLRPTAKFLRTLALIFSATVVVFLDQLTKSLVIASLQPRVSHDLFGSVVRLYLTYNNSAAFSMGFGITWIFTIISSLAALAIIGFGLRVRTLGWAVLAGTALGGVSGNLVDRVTRAPGFPSGQVVDFIQIPFNFPIFNLADSAICIAAALVVIAVARGSKLGG